MPPTLLIAHGMGIYNKPGWDKDIIQVLDECAADYDGLGDEPFSKQVSIVPIVYDSVFANWEKDIAKTATDVATFAAANPDRVDSSLLSLTTWLEDAASDDFVWSHVVDVILYRFFPDVVAEIHARVLEQITAAVVKAKKEAASTGQAESISIMCHSLGTAVIRDSLHRLGSEVYESRNATTEQYLARNGRLFDNIFMVANVGRVLQTRWPVHSDTCIRPESSGKGAYCAQYYNFRHMLDPFTAICPFGPQGWREGLTRKEDLAQVRAINVHGWSHYLRHPDVHARLFRAMFADGAIISDDELDEARDKYISAPSTVCSAARETLHADLAQLANGDPACTPRRILETAVGYFKTVLKAAKKCAITVGDIPI